MKQIGKKIILVVIFPTAWKFVLDHYSKINSHISLAYKMLLNLKDFSYAVYTGYIFENAPSTYKIGLIFIEIPYVLSKNVFLLLQHAY